MLIKKPVKRPLILDVGAGTAEFSATLRKRNPSARVIGVDRNPRSKAKIKASMGEFFLYKLKDLSRVKKVWLNHVDIFSAQAFVEFKAMVEKLPVNTTIMLTMRQENMELVRNALHSAGLSLRSETKWNPKMLGSPVTKLFYKQATEGMAQGKMLIRIVAVKKG